MGIIVFASFLTRLIPRKTFTTILTIPVIRVLKVVTASERVFGSNQMEM